MKSTRFASRLFIGLLAFSLLPAIAQAKRYNIQVLATFDYPNIPGRQILTTQPLGINGAGDVVGFFTTYKRGDSFPRDQGFIRYADATFSDPIIEPNQGGDVLGTRTTGIADNGDICGWYETAGSGIQSFILTGGAFLEYQVAGATDTYLYGINNAGDLVGRYYHLPMGAYPFADIGGTVTAIHIRASHNNTLTFPQGINNADQIVGYYRDDVAMSDSAFFGYSASRVKAPIAAPNMANTMLMGLNDAGLAVGTVDNDTDATEAILFQLQHSFTAYRYPGAEKTSFNGINNSGIICGSYTARGVVHGFIAQATLREGP